MRSCPFTVGGDLLSQREIIYSLARNGTLNLYNFPTPLCFVNYSYFRLRVVSSVYIRVLHFTWILTAKCAIYIFCAILTI